MNHLFCFNFKFHSPIYPKALQVVLIVIAWLALFSCSGRSKSLTPITHSVVTDSGPPKEKQVINNPCPNFDSIIYNNSWVRLPKDCYLTNEPMDSVFVINQSEFNFTEFVQRTGVQRVKDFGDIDKDIYTTEYPKFYISQKLLTQQVVESYYEDAEIFGYGNIKNINYVAYRGYGACMGHSTIVLSVNKENKLLDQIMLEADFSGKYGDGPSYSVKRKNDTTYYQIYEITGCKGWDDQVKKDSLFREYYQKTRITFTGTGYFKKDIIEIDSTEKFIRMVNICGPE